MNRLYWFVNKPWEAVPIWLRAIRVSHISRRLRDEAHAAWAQALLGNTPMPAQGHGSARHKQWGPATGSGWTYDPHDGFPYPPK